MKWFNGEARGRHWGGSVVVGADALPRVTKGEVVFGQEGCPLPQKAKSEFLVLPSLCVGSMPCNGVDWGNRLADKLRTIHTMKGRRDV